MHALLCGLAAAVRAVFCHRADLVLENLALRQQLALLGRRRPRPRLSVLDRAFGVGLAKLWPGWRDTLAIVQPATVIRWHRLGFRLFWRWRSRPTGRPSTKADTRTLIRRIASESPGWGAPRIHGELLKLGIAVAQSTIAKYMQRRNKPPSPTWRTFLQNHMSCAAGIASLRSRRPPSASSTASWSSATDGAASSTSTSPSTRPPSGPATSCAPPCLNRRASSIATAAPPSRGSATSSVASAAKRRSSAHLGRLGRIPSSKG